MKYRVIIDNEYRDRSDHLVSSFTAAVLLAQGAVDSEGFLSVRVFDDDGHIVAQAYSTEGSVLRP